MQELTQVAISEELLQALEIYADHANTLLAFIGTKCPKLTQVQSVQLSSLILKNLVVILSERES